MNNKKSNAADFCDHRKLLKEQVFNEDISDRKKTADAKKNKSRNFNFWNWYSPNHRANQCSRPLLHGVRTIAEGNTSSLAEKNAIIIVVDKQSFKLGVAANEQYSRSVTKYVVFWSIEMEQVMCLKKCVDMSIGV